MADRLSIYNGALRLLKERKLASLSETREPRRLLDDVWDDDYLRTVLEQASWIFATRSNKVDYSPSVTPPFGLQYAFDKPEDWVRTVTICTDDRFNNHLVEVQDEAGYWFADFQTIYVRYISSDSAYGADLSNWPASFTRYVEAYFAEKIAPRLLKTEAETREIERKMRSALQDARGKDALNDGAASLPMGSWASARLLGSRGSRWNGRFR